MEARDVEISVRTPFVYAGNRLKRRAVLKVPTQVAEHLIETKKARLYESETPCQSIVDCLPSCVTVASSEHHCLSAVNSGGAARIAGSPFVRA